MNLHTLGAFEDELVKMGKLRSLGRLRSLVTRRPTGWSAGGAELGSTRGMRGIEAGEALSKQAPQSSIQKMVGAKERDVARQMASTAGKTDAEIMSAVKAGKLDPKVHSMDTFRATGEVVPRPTRSMPTPSMTRAQTGAQTRVLRGGSAASGGAQVLGGGVPPSIIQRLKGRYMAMPQKARQALSGGALATAGLGGGVGIGSQMAD
jgi:hypothetical protein